MKRNKTMALVLAGVMAASALAGCGSKGVTAETSKAGTSGKTEESSAAGEKTVDLEVWYTNTGFLEVKRTDLCTIFIRICLV